VFDPTTNEVIGKYRSNKVSGKYLLILPPQNDYKMDVGPREANGFKFDLDVPKQESINPLRQGIVYNASGENGTITVTNYFDATGKPDSVAFAKNRSLKEIEKQMVDMPEPTEVLASAQKIRDEGKKEAELALAEKAKNDSIKQAEKMALEIQQKAEEAKLLIERAKEDSLKQIAELAIQEKNDAEEAAKQAELAMAEKERLEAIRKVEEKALALLAEEAAAKVEKARLDSLKRAEETALQEKARIEEAAKEAELAIAEKEPLESIREAEKEALAILEKQTAAKTGKAKQDSIEVLVLRKQIATDKRTAESLEKELVAEALAKAAVDSTREMEELEKLKASHLAERAKRDSTNQANKLAEKQALLAKAEKERVDAIREAKKEEALALIKEEAAAKAQKDSLKRAEAIALQERAQVDEAARQAEIAIAEKERLATIREAEEKALALLEEETKAKKARQDSLKQAEEIASQEKAQIEEVAKEAELAKAEKERLAAINKEVELAKQQAMRDSLIQAELVDNAKDESVSYDEILKEMAQKEAEILEEQEVLGETTSLESIIPDSSSTAILAAIPDTAKADLTKEPQSETKTLSASELFLQTIAKLEAQKNAQEELVSQENEDRKKAESDRKLAQAEAAKAADTTALKNSSIDTLGLEVANSEKNVEPSDTSDIETMSVALKSDANPAEYLAALDKIESEIAKEAEINKDKTYELKELNPAPISNNKEAEPALQAKVDADRKALAAHQKIAVEKERLLNEQMQRDREAVTSIDEAAEVELASMEREVLNELESGVDKSVKTATKGRAVTSEVESTATETKPEIAAKIENAITVTEEETEVTAENSEVDKQNVSSSERDVLDALAAFDEILGTTKDSTMVEEQTQSEFATAKNEAPGLLQKETAVKTEKSKQDSINQTEQIALQEKAKIEEAEQLAELAKAEKRALALLEGETAPKAEKAKQDSLKQAEQIVLQKEKANLEEAPKQAELAEAITEPELLIEEVVETPVSENVPVEIADNKQELVLPAVENNQQAESNSGVISSSEDGVGEIPFMTAALRDYGTRSKPSFDEIENPSMRRMIKRMRSEDIGRIAVLKNMKNDWVDAGKSAESLKNIKENIRNKDVLETVASAPSREEYVRAPFDKNTLRKRKDVHYKLELGISTSGVSETISETMTPEQAISFVMPEFDLQTGYYQTLADAESDYKEYRSRGFETVRIVPYLKNEPVRLSDVAEAPFID
ncbi:MAG TPA: hypothetical protein DCR04_07535, partial [Flavobacteriales bacterium]|nr:hypothetical protein [Flavobacteriales bacterium]